MPIKMPRGAWLSQLEQGNRPAPLAGRSDLEPIRLTLPYPPTANLYWRHARGRTYRSKEAAMFIQQAGLIARQACAPQFTGNVSLSVCLFRPAKRGDLDNSLKVLIDALRGITYADDRQITEIHAYRDEDKHNPRAEVVIAAASEKVAECGRVSP